jgi:carboxypeptidase Taq
MWENLVGRSLPFWKYAYPKLQATFPQTLKSLSLDDFYFAINAVEPSLIRVEADEATYNLHIIIRFELEMALVANELSVEDVPEAWKAKYREYLGIEPPDDADGCLQDVHWSAALIGYFPTYSLGNLYAAQFFQQADQIVGGLHAQFERGEFRPLLDWLRTQIHHRGHCYSASELVQVITGQALSSAPFIRALTEKLKPLYGID